MKETESYKIDAPWSRIRTDEFDNGTKFRDGIVLTPNGIVAVSSIDGKRPRTLLEIVIKRRQYSHRANKSYSARYLVTLATRFAEAMSRKK